MKVAILLFAFAGLSGVPDGPAIQPNPNYPVHIQILATKASAGKYGARGAGRANILGSPVRGIDFTYDCNQAFLNNGPAEFYQARWIKPDQKLELLLQHVGSDQLDKCRLEIAYKAGPYDQRGK